MLNALAPVVPGLIGGSADLAPSNMTLMKMFGDFQKDTPAERNVRFGVREHAMGAISNGIGLHSPGFVPYCATFFIFTDYMRNPMRMAALSEVRRYALHHCLRCGRTWNAARKMGPVWGEPAPPWRCVASAHGLGKYKRTWPLTSNCAAPCRFCRLALDTTPPPPPTRPLQCGTVFVMTHDSIGLGEDGPTHQPVEHLASFRAMPNMLMMRPGDGNETAGAYAVAVANRKRPTTIALSRQGMPNLPGTSVEGTKKGGYIVHGTPAGQTPDVIIMGTGSELCMAVDAAKKLEAEGKKVRVVSMVCWELFEEQDAAYKESVLPKAVRARVSVEAGSSFGWCRFLGDKGHHVGIDSFGASAPAPALYDMFGITVDNVVKAAKASMA